MGAYYKPVSSFDANYYEEVRNNRNTDNDVYPEKIAGRILVKKLIDNISVEEIDVSNTIKIIKFVANESLIGRKISQIELEFSNLKIISYKANSMWSTKVDSSYQVKKDDILVFLGESENIKVFYKNLKIFK